MNSYISTLGGHSALEICLGAKRTGLASIVIAQKGRHRIYSQYYKNLVDQVITVDSFSELTTAPIIAILKEKNSIFIPHRYCQVYCDLKSLETEFPIPIFGNKYLLKYEEREGMFTQYQLMFNSRIPHPEQFKDPKNIDRLVLVKVREKERGYERAFYFCSNFKEFKEKGEKLIKEGKIRESDLHEAIIEEYLIGAMVNFNFFYSSVYGRLELLGTDTRRQTNLDGILRIPVKQQIELKDAIKPTYIETGHIAVTVKESLLEQAFSLAQNFVDGMKEFLNPGVIGPFALQTAILPGPPKERIVVYDLSLRMPGSPGSIFTPYSIYHFNKAVSFGERIAMEIKMALEEDQLSKITT